MSKKDSLIRGTIILAVAALVARFLGIAQRAPLDYLLGDQGGALFGDANTVYLMLLPIATAGIPSALSKLISEKTALGLHEEANRIFRGSLWFAAIAGVVVTIPLVAITPFYTKWAHLQDATLSIWAIAPALLVFPLIAMMRGYFQGRQMMMAGGVSQIIEQIARVAASIVLAAVIVSAGSDMKWVSAGASFGGFLGALGAFAVMVYYFRKLKRQDAAEGSGLSRGAGGERGVGATPLKSVFAGLLKLSIPISLFSAIVQIVYFIDSSIAKPLLGGIIGEEKAHTLLSILTLRAQSLAGIPVIFAVAVSQSLIPVISSAYAKADKEEVKRKATQAISLAFLTGLPVILVLCTAAEPINGLIFHNTEGSVMIALLTAGTLFQILMQTSAAILMGMGKIKMLLANVGLCIVVKLIGSLTLAQQFGMNGLVVSSGICFLASTIMNFLYLKKEIGFVFLGRKWFGVLVTTAVMAVVGFLLERWGRVSLHPFANAGGLGLKLDYALQAALIGVVLVVLFLLMMIATRVLTNEDVAHLPGPVRKLAQKGLRLLGQKPVSVVRPDTRREGGD